MSGDVRKSLIERELERGLSAFLVAPTILLVAPSILVPLFPGHLAPVFALSFAAAILSYLALSRRWLRRAGRDLLEFGGWKALLFWLVLTSLILGLVNWAWT